MVIARPTESPGQYLNTNTYIDIETVEQHLADLGYRA
jgi:hypothetical protein